MTCHCILDHLKFNICTIKLHCSSMLRRLTCVQQLGRLPAVRAQFRLLTSGKKDGDGQAPPPIGDVEDEFEDMSFSIGVDEPEIPVTVDEEPDDSREITPELASELVTRMVASVTEKSSGPSNISRSAMTKISPHTIEVLRASRITTNEVVAPGATFENYPINRKVVAEVDLARLRLSDPAGEALRIIAGKRHRGDHVVIACDSFRTVEENQALAVSRLDRLVRAAKEAVGDDVDCREIESWTELEQEVSSQLSSSEPDQTTVSFLLSRRDPRNETFVACVSQIASHSN